MRRTNQLTQPLRVSSAVFAVLGLSAWNVEGMKIQDHQSKSAVPIEELAALAQATKDHAWTLAKVDDGEVIDDAHATSSDDANGDGTSDHTSGNEGTTDSEGDGGDGGSRDGDGGDLEGESGDGEGQPPVPPCRCTHNEIHYYGDEWVGHAVNYQVGSKPVLFIPTMQFVGRDPTDLGNFFQWHVVNEFGLYRWIYENTETLQNGWSTFFPGYADMPTNDEEWHLWLQSEKTNVDPLDWDAWMQTIVDLFENPTTYATRDLTFTETIDSCHYYLSIEDADSGEPVNADDPFIVHFDGANHVVVFGTDDTAQAGTIRNFVVHAVSNYSGFFDSVNISFAIDV